MLTADKPTENDIAQFSRNPPAHSQAAQHIEQIEQLHQQGPDQPFNQKPTDKAAQTSSLELQPIKTNKTKTKANNTNKNKNKQSKQEQAQNHQNKQKLKQQYMT